MCSRPKVKITSSDVISSPLWNFTPLRSDSSTVRSSMRFQLSARPGIGSSLDLRLRAIRFSKIGICTRSPTLERSRTTSSEALFAICCTAIVIVGRSSAWPSAKRGKANPPAARLAPAMNRRRSTWRMFPPSSSKSRFRYYEGRLLQLRLTAGGTALSSRTHPAPPDVTFEDEGGQSCIDLGAGMGTIAGPRLIEPDRRRHQVIKRRQEVNAEPGAKRHIGLIEDATALDDRLDRYRADPDQGGHRAQSRPRSGLCAALIGIGAIPTMKTGHRD